MANRNSPQSPPLQNQVPNQMRIGIETTVDPDMPEHELTLSPVAGDHESDNFWALFTDWTWRFLKSGLTNYMMGSIVTNYMMGGLGLSVEEPEKTSKFHEIPLIIYRKNFEKQFLRYTTMITKQLKALKKASANWSITKEHSGRSDLMVGLLRDFESSLRDCRSPGAPGIRVAPWVYLVGAVEVSHITLVICFTVWSAI